MPNVITTIDGLNEVVDRFLDYDHFAFDTETKGEHRLDPRRNIAFWIQLAGPGLDVATIPFGHPIGHRIGTRLEPKLCSDGKVRQYKKPVWSEPPEQLTPAEVFSALKPLFFDKTKTKIGCNVKFDIETISKYFGEIPPGPYFDTQVADYLCDENHYQYSLDSFCDREFGFKWDKKIASALEEQPFKVAALYTHYDATYTLLGAHVLAKRLRQEKVMGVFMLEMDVLPVLCAMENEGADVDIDALRDLDEDLDRRLALIKSDLWRIAGRQWNFDSTRDKQRVFFDPKREGGQGLKPRKFTPKTHSPSTDAESLDSFVGNPLIDKFNEYQEINKLSSTYIKAYLGTSEKKKSASHDRNDAPPYNEETGRIHANFKQHGAKTGRFSCSEPNLQNIPRPDTELGQRIRGLFVAPPDHTLIVADWSQIEYRILAYYSRDRRLIQTFIDEIDFHTYVASLLLNKPMDEVTSVERTLSKNVNFACVPMDTEVLTRRGWVGYHDVNLSDFVLGYDGMNLTWVPILEKVHYPEAPLQEITNGRWTAVTTPNHRWDSMRRTGRGPTRHAVREFTTTESMTSEHVITLSAPVLDEEASVVISPDEAAIIAWLHTDGSIIRSRDVGAPAQSHGKKVKFQATIWQKKYVGEVEKVVRDAGAFRRYERRPHTGITGWVLDSSWIREVWKRARLDEQSLEQFVIGLSDEAREAFLHACWLAEGWMDKQGVKLLGQNEGPVLDAMKTAGFMCGYDVTDVITDLRGNKPYHTIRLRKPFVTGQRMRRRDLPPAPVWCIRTPTENFVMRQNGRAMLTGNTIYGAGTEKVAAMSGVSTEVAEIFRRAHEKMLPKVYAFCRQVIKDTRREDPPHLRTIMGRKRRLPEIVWGGDDNWSRRAYAERQAVNAKIQGSAADLMKLAIVRLDDCAPDYMSLLLTVHDELVAKVPDDRVEDGIAAMREAMMGQEIADLIAPVPLIADIKAVKRWSEAKSA